MHACVCKGERKLDDDVILLLNQFFSDEYVSSSSTFCKVAASLSVLSTYIATVTQPYV